jgi:hypothetical protein
MALQTSTTYSTPIGITVPTVYWRWIHLSIDVIAQRATGVVHGYASEAAYNNQAQPIARKQYTIEGDDFATLGTSIEPNLSDAFYNYVKAHDEELTGATTA